jgi:chloramphenicol-sensitive protein RarD
MNKGIWHAIGAYVAWGVLPVYWKWLQQVDAVQLISHRIVWSFVTLLAFILFSRQWKTFRAAVLIPRVLGTYLVAGLLIGINWLVYVWAVNAGFIIETSLGYFINPLISVLLGVILFRERLRAGQWISIGLALVGVLYLTLAHGTLPWIALTLAFCFGCYGLVKKTAPLGSFYGLTLETGILLLPAVLYLIVIDQTGQGAFLHSSGLVDVLLIGAGMLTTIPMLLFSSAAQRIPLSLIGVLQYIAPTIQFLLGVLVYKEPFTSTLLMGYGMVWSALILFAVEGFRAYRAQPVVVVAE